MKQRGDIQSQEESISNMTYWVPQRVDPVIGGNKLEGEDSDFLPSNVAAMVLALNTEVAQKK